MTITTEDRRPHHLLIRIAGLPEMCPACWMMRIHVPNWGLWCPLHGFQYQMVEGQSFHPLSHEGKRMRMEVVS